MNKSRYYPLHLAVLNNHFFAFDHQTKISIFQDCVKVLLDFDARIDAFTTLSTEKLTPIDVSLSKRIFTNCEISN